MRLVALVALAASLVLTVSELSAQAKASFAGTWTRVDDSANPPPQGQGGLGASLKIDQDAKTLTITRSTQTGESKSVYNLDGTESKNTIGGRSGARFEAVSRTRWDANKLVITTNLNYDGNTIENSLTMSLDASGNLLVESTSPVRVGGPATTTKSIYKKG